MMKPAIHIASILSFFPLISPKFLLDEENLLNKHHNRSQ